MQNSIKAEDNSGLSALHIAGIVFISAALAVVTYLTQSFWGDEILSIHFSREPWSAMIAECASDLHPPLYFVLLKLWLSVFGDGEFGLRIFQGLQAGFFYAGALLLFRRFRTRVSSSMLFALTLISAELWLFLPMLRYYALSAAFAVFALYVFFTWIESGKRKHAALLGLLFVLILYTDYPTAFVVAVLGLYVLWAERKRLKAFLLICISAGAVFLPWAIIVVDQIRTLKYTEAAAEMNTSPVYFVVKLVYGFYGLLFGETIYPIEAAALVAIAVLAVLLGYFFVSKKYRGMSRQDVFILVAPFIALLFTALITTFFSKQTSFILTPSRTLYALPLLFIGIGILCRQAKSPVYTWLLAGTIAAISLYGVVNYALSRHFINPVYSVPWEQVVQDCEGENNLALVDMWYCYEYYADHTDAEHPAALLNRNYEDVVDSARILKADTIFVIVDDRVTSSSILPPNLQAFVEAHSVYQSSVYYAVYDPIYRRIKGTMLGAEPGKAKMESKIYTVKK